MQFDSSDPRQAMIVELRESNLQRIRAMQEMREAWAPEGITIQINRESAVLEFLLDHLVGMSPARLVFEREQAQHIAETLDSVDVQVRQQRLTAGVSPLHIAPNGRT